jgi:hypothetical protein
MSSPVTSITASCLCKSIFFTINFPSSSAWRPDKNASCQCSNCRKFTGSLVPQSFQVETENIQPVLTSFQTYRTYDSGPDSFRGFCTNCGSSLTHNDEEGFTEIWLGCVDVEFLSGRQRGEAIQTEFGSMSERFGGLGKELCTAHDHLWMRNAVAGLTDRSDGLKFWGNRTDGKPFECDVSKLWEYVKGQR